MNLELLKDNVYLTLLAFYNGQKMPKYTTIGNIVNITRQTVAKRVKNLIDSELIFLDENNIVSVKNELNINVNVLAEILTTNPNANVLYLKNKLFQNEDNSNKTAAEEAEELNISVSTFYNCQKERFVVYGIISEGVIKYVGSTKCYENRIKQHILTRPFLNMSNFIILKEVTEENRFFEERQLISIIQPEWNIMSKEF